MRLQPTLCNGNPVIQHYLSMLPGVSMLNVLKYSKESQLDSWLVFFYIIFEDISWALVGPCDTWLLTIHVKAHLRHCPQMSPNEVMNASFSRRFLVLAPAIPCYVMAYQVGFEGDSPPQSSNLNLTPLDSNYGSRRLFCDHVPLSS